MAMRTRRFGTHGATARTGTATVAAVAATAILLAGGGEAHAAVPSSDEVVQEVIEQVTGEGADIVVGSADVASDAVVTEASTPDGER